jgi:hypothetical protein
MNKHLKQFGSKLANKKNKSVVFVVLFALTGIAMLIITRAATVKTVSIEAEGGTMSNGAVVVDNTSASGGKAVKFASPAPPVTLKPQVKGAIDRDAYDTNTAISKTNIKIPTAYDGIVNDFVLMLKWKQLQPSNSTELNTSYIDDAISEAKGRNMHFKFRILAGIHAPDWVKNLAGGSFAVYDIDKTAGEVFTGTAPRYWTSDVKGAYSGLMSKLASKYDNDDTMLSVVNSLCTTIFAEPFIKNLDEGNNMTSFYNAGLTDALDQQCLNDSVDIHNAHWKRTRTETAINPLSYKGTDGTGAIIERFNVDFSINWIKRCRVVLGARCIMGNNGFNATSGAVGSNYRKVIGAIICEGNPPPYFQTRQQSVIESTGKTLTDVLNYVIAIGAGMIEMPVQYRTTAITPEQLRPLDAALEANNAIACPADKLLPNPA